MIVNRIVLNQKEFDSLLKDVDYYKIKLEEGFIYKEFKTDNILGYYDKCKDCYYIEAAEE